MDITGKSLWICGGISAAALVCCLALGIAVRSQGQLIDRLQVDVRAVATARHADDVAQALKNELYQEAQTNAQGKYEILDGVRADEAGVSDADYLDRLRRVWVLPQGTNGDADTAGKPDAGLPKTRGAGSHDADR